jgi:hypothetical protein
MAARTLAEIAMRRAHWYARIALGRARRAGRLSASSIGLPVHQEFLIVDCADGDDASGLFSEVAAVVGCVAEVEAHPGVYAGMRVDFGTHGLYYDAAMGSNWWNYFFEPLAVGAPDGRSRALSDWEHDAFASEVELRMPRAEAARIVSRHVVPRATIRSEVDRFWRSNLAGECAIGVHYRGTDKWEGRPPIPYESVAAAIQDAVGVRGVETWRLFLATDEQPCVEFLTRAFPGRVIFREMARSSDGRPLHKVAGNGFHKGHEATIDCLLLARCAHLVRTDSDLSLFATFFNPTLPVTLLGTVS